MDRSQRLLKNGARGFTRDEEFMSTAIIQRNRHSRESGNPGLKHVFKYKFTTWIPAFAGMTFFLLVFTANGFASDPLKEFPSRVKKITLKNGFRALIVERPDSPTVSFSMYIRTGGVDHECG